MTKVNISIPQPCHENWEAMTSVEKGKFCNSCQKKVFDFTKASDREIVNAFQQNQNLCGRFLNTQLDRDLVKPEKKNSLWLATTTALISMVGLNEVTAQEKVPVEQTDQRALGKFMVTPKTTDQEIEVSGNVSDIGGPLPGAYIAIKGSDVKIVCDFDGNFTLRVKKNDILIITYVGYNTKEIQISDSNRIEIVLKESNITLGGMILGGIHAKKRTFFGRIFQSIGDLFK
ncbi:MAG: carboxypeptidase-like regulatory domain-containing protein [Bacteroidota bacterium]